MSNASLKQQAYTRIKNDIVECNYPPGMVLNEEMLCDRLGISRTPTRDAISRLEQDGLVRIIPKKGIVVSELSIEELNKVYEARLLLEPYAIHHYGIKLDFSCYDGFYQRLLEAKTDASQSGALYHLDDLLHKTFIKATENPYLIQAYDRISAQNHRLRILSGSTLIDRMAQTRDEHIEIVECCLQQNWKAAGEAVIRHLEMAKKVAFQAIFTRNAERGSASHKA